MEEKKYPVITISREYCALGRSLAAELSERFGIPYYDRDFVSKTVKESGYEVDEVKEESEDLSPMALMLDRFLGSTVAYTSSHDAIFKAQKNVILEMAKTPCIIVGRCADHILREAGIDAFSIFLYGSEEERIKRAVERKKNGSTPAEKYVEKRDKLRRTFYKRYTGNEMGNASNYSICLDTSRISLKTCADIIAMILEEDWVK